MRSTKGNDYFLQHRSLGDVDSIALLGVFGQSETGIECLRPVSYDLPPG
jgi:hypothetical protein